jgi:hypothetical protein
MNKDNAMCSKYSHFLKERKIQVYCLLKCNYEQSSRSLCMFRMLLPSSGSKFKPVKQAALKLLSDFSSVPTMEEIHSSTNSNSNSANSLHSVLVGAVKN